MVGGNACTLQRFLRNLSSAGIFVKAVAGASVEVVYANHLIFLFSHSSLAVDRFPIFEKDTRESNTNSIERARGSGPVQSNIKLQDHNHNREVIFALPSLQLHFKTEHLQPAAPDLKRKYCCAVMSKTDVSSFCSQQKTSRLLSAASLPNSRTTFS